MKNVIIFLATKSGTLLGSKFSETKRKKIKKNLDSAYIDISAEQYLSFLLIVSVLGALYASMLVFVITSDMFLAAVKLVLAFGIIYFCLNFYPGFEAAQRGKKIEAELPTVLRMIGVQLDIKIQFEKIIQNIAEEDYEISKEFEIVMREIKSGSSIPAGLQRITERVDSETVARIVNQLVMNYEKGGGGKEIKQIANQLTEMQTTELKAFESKMAFTGLIFIAVSCIMPAFFQIFISIGSVTGMVTLTSMQVWVIFVLVFPVISFIAFILINLSTPQCARLHESSFENDINTINRLLKNMGWVKNRAQLKHRAVIFITAAVLGSLLFVVMGGVINNWFYYIALIILLTPFMLYFYILFLAEDRIIKMEKQLPDALAHAAMLQKNMSTEKIIEEISKQKGLLGQEFKIAYRQISAGSSIKSALNSIAERNNSILLKRATGLIVQGYYAGADMYSALRETAEDIYSLFALVSQRKSVLTLQKYTLIFGGAVLVPLILGSIVHVTGVLNSESFSVMTTGTMITGNSEILNSIVGATQVYLFIFSFISGLMIAYQENEPRKAVIYIVLFLICTTVLYNIALSYAPL